MNQCSTSFFTQAYVYTYYVSLKNRTSWCDCKFLELSAVRWSENGIRIRDTAPNWNSQTIRTMVNGNGQCTISLTPMHKTAHIQSSSPSLAINRSLVARGVAPPAPTCVALSADITLLLHYITTYILGWYCTTYCTEISTAPPCDDASTLVRCRQASNEHDWNYAA